MMGRVMRVTLLIAVAVVALAVAASAQQKSNTATGSARHSPRAAATTPGPDYVIGPGDVLDISVWKQPQISLKGLPVRPDGKISLPLLNDIQAAGLTAMQLANEITQGLKKYIEAPQVTVVVAAVNSQRYYVMGEVPHPGVFPLLPGITVLQAISAAGGFTQFANPKKTYILRMVNGKQEKLPFNYKAVINGKELQENIQLQPGDQIIVP